VPVPLRHPPATDVELQENCRWCKHHWNRQCCNVFAQVQRACGTPGKCRHFSPLSDYANHQDGNRFAL
jgi:hypothetical protein